MKAAACRVGGTRSCISSPSNCSGLAFSSPLSLGAERPLQSTQRSSHAETGLYISLENQGRTLVKHIVQKPGIFKAFISSSTVLLKPFKLWDGKNIEFHWQAQIQTVYFLKKNTSDLYYMTLLRCTKTKMQKDCTYC